MLGSRWVVPSVAGYLDGSDRLRHLWLAFARARAAACVCSWCVGADIRCIGPGPSRCDGCVELCTGNKGDGHGFTYPGPCTSELRQQVPLITNATLCMFRVTHHPVSAFAVCCLLLGCTVCGGGLLQYCPQYGSGIEWSTGQCESGHRDNDLIFRSSLRQ